MITNSLKNKKRGSLKNTFYSLLFLFLLLTILVYLAVTNIKIMARREKLSLIIADLEKEIKMLEKNNEELKAKMSQLGSREYLEKVAREQFNLKAPGEKVVVIYKDNKETEKKELDNFSENKEQKEKWFDIKKIWNFLNSFLRK